jgi:DNA-binding MarR family transcriptional regulator
MAQPVHSESSETEKEQRNALTRQAFQGMKRTFLRFRTLMDEQLRPRGVTTAQVQVLFAVRTTPGSSGAQLARSCFITPQSTQSLLKQLENSGLIERSKDKVNDRIVTTRLTPAGEQLAKEVDKISVELQESIWQGISYDDLAQMNATLEACIANLGAAE